MILLVIGVVVFIGIHLVPSSPKLRTIMIMRFGEKAYAGLFSVFALLGLIVIVIGKIYSEFHALWQPPEWGKHGAMLLMPIAFILLAASHMPNNLKRYLRHPMMWGVVVWSISHLIANGDVASLILFGSIGLFALISMLSANWRGANLSEQILPIKKDFVVVVAGLVAHFIFAFLHPYLFGVAIIS